MLPVLVPEGGSTNVSIIRGWLVRRPDVDGLLRSEISVGNGMTPPSQADGRGRLGREMKNRKIGGT